MKSPFLLDDGKTPNADGWELVATALEYEKRAEERLAKRGVRFSVPSSEKILEIVLDCLRTYEPAKGLQFTSYCWPRIYGVLRHRAISFASFYGGFISANVVRYRMKQTAIHGYGSGRTHEGTPGPNALRKQGDCFSVIIQPRKTAEPEIYHEAAPVAVTAVSDRDAEIRRRKKAGWTAKQLAKKYDLHYSRVNQICRTGEAPEPGGVFYHESAPDVVSFWGANVDEPSNP